MFPADLATQLASCRKTLHDLRSKRPRPGLDDKVGAMCARFTPLCFIHCTHFIYTRAAL